MMSIESSHKFRVFSFVFTLLVVIYHARFSYLSQTRLVMQLEPFFLRVYEYLCGISMAYFFMTSGYMLCNGLTRSNAVQKYKRRIKTLLIPLSIWNIIYLTFDFLFRRDSLDFRPIVTVYRFFFDPYDGPLWYLFALFLLSSLVIIIFYLIKNKLFIIAVGFLFIILSICIDSFHLLVWLGGSEKDQTIIWLTRLSRYFPGYLIGCYLGMYHKECIDYRFSNNEHFAAITLIVVMSLYIIFIPRGIGIIKQMIFTVLPILIWVFVDSGYFKDEPSSIVRGAFLIYAMHFMIIRILRSFLEKSLPQNINDTKAFIIWLFFPFFSVILTYFSSRLFSHSLKKLHLSKVENILTGNRR